MSGKALVITLVLLLCWASSVSAETPAIQLEQLGEKIELMLTPPEKKPGVRFEHAFKRLVEAKDLWVEDKDQEAKDRLSQAWENFAAGIILTKENIAQSPQVEDAKKILGKLERETRSLLEQPDETLESLKESLRRWFDS